MNVTRALALPTPPFFLSSRSRALNFRPCCSVRKERKKERKKGRKEERKKGRKEERMKGIKNENLVGKASND
jgi:hypothetical protein